jgi:putative transcriptional regulator
MTSNRIRRLREARGLTQDRLGELVGSDKFKLSRIETGKQPLDLDLATKIARVLDVTIAEVLGIEEGGGLSEEAAPYEADSGDPLRRLEDPQRNRTLYRVTCNALDELGIRAGDVVLVDFSADAVKRLRPLQPVIAQLYDPSELTRAVTLVRQFVPPSLLVTNSRTDNRPPVNMATMDAHVKGVIISWHRTM